MWSRGQKESEEDQRRRGKEVKRGLGNVTEEKRRVESRDGESKREETLSARDRWKSISKAERMMLDCKLGTWVSS